MPVHLGDDGASITIENETFQIPREAAGWFAAQPDPEEAFRIALRTGAATMERGGYLEFDGDTQRGNGRPGVQFRMVPVATPKVLSEAEQKAHGLRQIKWERKI